MGDAANLKEWLLHQTVLLRKANQNAQKASQEWNILNAEWQVAADGSGWNEYLDRTRRKGENEPLKAVWAKYTFWRDEANRIANFIQAELALRTLMEMANALGQNDSPPAGPGPDPDQDAVGR